jgi:hypothetical protein
MVNDMSETSPILGPPYIQPSQAQKHVTHNEAIRTLDGIVQLTLTEIDATTPPGVPQSDAVYALGAGAGGAWAGHDFELAFWRDTAWHFLPPLEGWLAWNKADSPFRVWNNGAWERPAGETDNLSSIGINTTADLTNRLSVKSDATLLTHDGTDHQLKINKASSSDTASLLFQTNWSGRVEFGLSGSDDFVVKTSANGSDWTTAISVDHTTGFVGVGTANSSFPMTITHNDAGNPITLRLQNWSGEASTIASTRGMVLSADHDDNSSGAQSFIAFEVSATEYARLAANGTMTVGVSANKPAVHIKDILRIEPGAGPNSPAAGDIYFDSVSSKLRCYDGTIWHDLF